MFGAETTKVRRCLENHPMQYLSLSKGQFQIASFRSRVKRVAYPSKNTGFSWAKSGKVSLFAFIIFYHFSKEWWRKTIYLTSKKQNVLSTLGNLRSQSWIIFGIWWWFLSPMEFPPFLLSQLCTAEANPTECFPPNKRPGCISCQKADIE